VIKYLKNMNKLNVIYMCEVKRMLIFAVFHSIIHFQLSLMSRHNEESRKINISQLASFHISSNSNHKCRGKTSFVFIFRFVNFLESCSYSLCMLKILCRFFHSCCTRYLNSNCLSLIFFSV
jgi:hypothetical protein